MYCGFTRNISQGKIQLPKEIFFSTVKNEWLSRAQYAEKQMMCLISSIRLMAGEAKPGKQWGEAVRRLLLQSKRAMMNFSIKLTSVGQERIGRVWSDIRDAAEVTNSTRGSQSFNWQVKEEGLIKKTESEGLICTPEKDSERVGVTKGQFQLRKNEKCCKV